MIGGIIRRPPPALAAIPNGIEVPAKKSRYGGINKISAGKQKEVTLWVAIGSVDTFDSKEEVPVHELSHGEPATQFHPRTIKNKTRAVQNSQATGSSRPHSRHCKETIGENQAEDSEAETA